MFCYSHVFLDMMVLVMRMRGAQMDGETRERERVGEIERESERCRETNTAHPSSLSCVDTIIYKRKDITIYTPQLSLSLSFLSVHLAARIHTTATTSASRASGGVSSCMGASQNGGGSSCGSGNCTQ